MRRLPLPAQAYACLLVAAALVVVGRALWQPPPWPTLGALVLLLLVADSGSTLLVREGVRLSAGFAVALAAVVILGPVGAAIVGAAGAFAYHGVRLPIVKRAVNGAIFAVSAFGAATVYQALGSGMHGSLGASDFPAVFLPFSAAVVAHFVVNIGLLAGIFRLAEGVPPRRVWKGVLTSWVGPYLAYGTLGLTIAAMWATIGAVSAPLALLPLFIARWVFAQHAAERAAYDATIAALCQAVETKDYYTRGHCERVARASVLIARQLDMRESRVGTVHYAGMLHDVGKLGVATDVLQKSGALTEEEFGAIQLHPTRGAEIVQDIAFLGETQAAIVHHHERMDGRGYPTGLRGTDIPELARVIGVADAFDSMTSTRSYRSARTPTAAIAELRRHGGTQFDSVMVEALVRAVDRHGWQPHEPAAPRAAEAAALSRDHDDPSAPLPVAGGGPPT